MTRGGNHRSNQVIRLKHGLNSNQTLPDRSSLSPKRGEDLITANPYQQAEPKVENVKKVQIKETFQSQSEVVLPQQPVAQIDDQIKDEVDEQIKTDNV